MFKPCGENEWECSTNGLYCYIELDPSDGSFFWEVADGDPFDGNVIDNGYTYTMPEAITECRFVADNY